MKNNFLPNTSKITKKIKLSVNSTISKIFIFLFHKKINGITVFNKNIEIVNIYPTSKFQMPVLHDIEYENKFEAYDSEIKEAFLLKIKNGIFVCGKEEVYTADGNVINEITSQKYNPQLNKSKEKLLKFTKLNGTVLCLSLSGLEENYYHFNVEFLARWYLFSLTNYNYDYIDFNCNKAFQQQFIKLLNIPHKKIIPLNMRHRSIKADLLLVPSLINNWNYHKMNEGRIHHMKQHLPYWFKEVHKDLRHQFKSSTRIYISREKADRRKVINESEVINLINNYGFTAYHLEELSIIEQIYLFNKAECIISPHGAGLVNMVYCSKPFKVLELYPLNYHDSSFRILAQILDCTYDFLICRECNINHIDPQLEDLSIDCAKLEKWLNLLN